jgi:hypothetical protein
LVQINHVACDLPRITVLRMNEEEAYQWFLNAR